MLNFRVRDGTGCFTCAMTTKPRKSPCRLSCFAGKRRGGRQRLLLAKGALPLGYIINQHRDLALRRYPTQGQCMLLVLFDRLPLRYLRRRACLSITGSNQAYRAISTGQLNALLRLHLRPIDVVVFHGPQGDLVLRGASRLDAFSGYPVRS